MPAGVTQAIRRRQAGLTLGVAVLAMLVIATIASGAAATGGSGRVGLSAGATRPAGEVVVAAFSGLLVVSAALAVVVVFFLVSSGRRKKDADAPEHVSEAPPTSWVDRVVAILLPLLLVGGLAAVIVYAAHHAKPPVSTAALPGGTASGLSGGVRSLSHASGGGTGAVEVGLVAGICVVAAAAALVIFLRMRRRSLARRLDRPDRSPHAAAVADTVALSIDDLRHERDPRRAIDAAYARMERAFAALGLPRAVGQTSGEYMRRVLSLAAAPAPPVVELTDLFQEAKFSRHRLTSEDREDALRALLAIKEAIQ